MKELDDYFAAERKVHDFFGFEGCWRVFPLEDMRKCFWYVDEDGQEVKFDYSEEPFLDKDLGPQYSNSIISPDFSPEDSPGVYRKDGYTMIVVDTQCDGNKFLAIFDNTKEMKMRSYDC